MSSDKTQHLQMHKWVGTDFVQRQEVNENFEKIDEHLAKKAQQIDLGNLETSVESYRELSTVPREISADDQLNIENGKYNHFGLLLKTRDGMLMLHYESESHMAHAGRIIARKSYDGGQSIDYQTLVSDANDNRGIGGVVLPNGRVVVIFTKTNVGVTSFVGHYSMYSDDNGLTWSNPVRVPFESANLSLVYGKAIHIKGKILQPYYQYTSTGAKVGLLQSTDKGVSFTTGGVVYEGTENVTECAIEVFGNKIFAMIRREEVKDGSGNVTTPQAIKQLISTNEGTSFTFIRDNVFANEKPVSPFLGLVVLPNNKKMLVLYYHDRLNGKLNKRFIKPSLFNTTTQWGSPVVVKTTPVTPSGYPSMVTFGGDAKVLLYEEVSTSISNVRLVTDPIENIVDYDTGWVAVTKGTTYTFVHGLGNKPTKIETLISQDPIGYPILNNGDTIKTTDIGTTIRVDQNNIYVGCGSNAIFSFFAGSPVVSNPIGTGFIRIKLYL